MNKIIGVDFDGTLSATIDYPLIGEPIQEVLDYVLQEQKKRCVCNFNYYA